MHDDKTDDNQHHQHLIASHETVVDPIVTGCGVTAGGEMEILTQMVSTSLGPLSRLSETLDLTLNQVSEWIAKPESRRQIFNLLGLLNAQTELLIAQHRVTAAIQLARLTRDENAGPETVRRACKDLLNVRLIERSRPATHGRRGDDLEPIPLPKPPITHADILRTLREIG